VRIKVINPILEPDWNQLINSLAGNTIFHTSEWARILTETYGYTPNYMTAVEDGQVVGALPIMDVRSYLTGNRGVSLPFSDQCPALSDDLAAFDELWNYAKSLAVKRGWKYIELRGMPASDINEPSFQTYCTHTMRVDRDPGSIEKQLRDSTRRNVKRANKSGLTIKIDYGLDAILAFYRLNCLTRKRHGLPPQPIKLFHKIHRYLVSQQKGFTILALLKDRPIAAGMFFHHNRTLVYKYGASEQGYEAFRPNNLIIWEAILWAAKNGCRKFDFGRTNPEHSGLLQFKRGWGCQQGSLNYYRYDVASACFSNGTKKLKNDYSLFRRLPLPLLKLSGRILYRHVG